MYGAGLGGKAMEENTETTLRFMDRPVGGCYWNPFLLSLLTTRNYMSYSLNSLKGFYIGDYIGDYYKGY